jgi:peptidoglycan hydrolase-like protein with peptidoglycan-binding domain
MYKILLTTALAVGLTAIPATLAAQDSTTVREAQQALKDKGFDPGPADGINGPKTRAAIRDFQKQQNLNADGRLGPQTLGVLGVKDVKPTSQFKAAGSNLTNSYGKGGKDIGRGSKNMGHEVKKGEVGAGAVDFGKGVGHGAAKMGKGTAHAAENAAKGVKNAVVPNKDHDKDHQ